MADERDGMTPDSSTGARLRALIEDWRENLPFAPYSSEARSKCADELEALLLVSESHQQETHFDLLDDPTRGLHAVLTRFGLASRTDFMPLVTALVSWAADACRSTIPQNEQAWADLAADGGLPESHASVTESHPSALRVERIPLSDEFKAQIKTNLAIGRGERPEEQPAIAWCNEHGQQNCPRESHPSDRLRELAMKWTEIARSRSIEAEQLRSQGEPERADRLEALADEGHEHAHQLSAVRASQPSEWWQPIETAPKDTWVIVCVHEDCMGPSPSLVVPAYRQDGVWRLPVGFALADQSPTHWQPLPAPPSLVRVIAETTREGCTHTWTNITGGRLCTKCEAVDSPSLSAVTDDTVSRVLGEMERTASETDMSDMMAVALHSWVRQLESALKVAAVTDDPQEPCGACYVNRLVTNQTPCCEAFVEPTCYGVLLCDADDASAYCEICGHIRSEHQVAAVADDEGPDTAEIRCRHCGEDVRLIDDDWLDRETGMTCDRPEGFPTQKHEPLEQGEDAVLVAAITAIVREADRAFEKAGGGSRHWVRECFLPMLNAGGFEVLPIAQVSHVVTKHYPCGCSATGASNIPGYCPTHGSPLPDDEGIAKEKQPWP